MHPIFMPSCAGASRHQRLVRKHVPDSDPGCALQSTSMPALHRRNVPNCRPMADGGMRKCTAGACPPQGSGWGVAESAVPIRCTKPQLRLFIPWCAGASRHGRLVRKHVPDYEPGWVVPVESPPNSSFVCCEYLTPAIKSMPRTPIRGGNPGEGRPARPRATLSRYGHFRHNLRSLFDHNLQTRRTNYAQI